MAAPKYVQRIARLPEVFDRLAAHPDGVALSELAAGLDVPAGELREDLLAFYAADVHTLFMGLSRPTVLEFFGPDGEDDDPNSAEIVRINEEKPTDELGVEYVSASELALIYTAASALLDIEHDEHLAGAVEVLTETMFGDPRPPTTGLDWNRPLEPLQRAISERRNVHVVYSRSWRVGVIERVIEPYLLVQTRRGWEIDAGPPDEYGALRTYLLSNIRSLDLLEETFAEPDDLAIRLAAQRETDTVRVQMPHAARWAADFYAEEVRLVADDETSATLDLDLLPPLAERVGRLLLACGPDSVVLSPGALVAEASTTAAELLAHHRQTSR